MANGCESEFKCPDGLRLPEDEKVKLEQIYGRRYGLGRKKKIKSIGEQFWAALHMAERKDLYDKVDKKFYRYDVDNNIFTEVTADRIKQEISYRILEESREQNIPELQFKRTNQELNKIVAVLKKIAEIQYIVSYHGWKKALNKGWECII